MHKEEMMTTWRSKALGDGLEAFVPTGKIQDAYTAMELTTQLPNDCAVFTYYDLGANVVTAYFSPSAHRLAEMFGATRCQKPERREGFSLSVGSLRAWDLLFGK
jgi:hypothetical protein